jgi:hypothetical protein
VILNLSPAPRQRRTKNRWHQRRLFLRFVQIGGYGTNEPKRTAFIFFTKLWARRSESLGRWIFATGFTPPAHRTTKELNQ